MKNNEKGFTLAELLIVVAIIGVLVAVSIPVFTAQLEKAREATDIANLRAADAVAASVYLLDKKTIDTNVWIKGDGNTYTAWYDIEKGTVVKEKPLKGGKGQGKGTQTVGSAANVISNGNFQYEATDVTGKCIKCTVNFDSDTQPILVVFE